MDIASLTIALLRASKISARYVHGTIDVPAADSWVALDPSYKQYAFKKGLDAVALSGIEPEQLAQSFINSGTVNDSEGWATGFDAGILSNAQWPYDG